MEWTADVSAGDWLRERVDDPWRGTMHDAVPRGFAAYVRVFHPTTRSKPIGDAWPPLPYDDHRREWEAFGARMPEIETLPATWADVARAFGTELHATAQWGALARARGAEWNPSDWQQVTGPDGWQFDAPSEGRLDPPVLAAVAEHLAAQTTTPDDGFAALWEGWGGVTGGMGYGPSRAFLTLTFDTLPSGEVPKDAEAARHEEFLARAAREQFEKPFRSPTWQPGILSDDISKGPRFTLPGRDHVLFHTGVTTFADAGWPQRMPWIDTSHARAQFIESPSLIWPADHAWALVTEVDWDSTIVGGSPELVRAIVADPRVEALPIREGARLQWDSDDVNR